MKILWQLVRRLVDQERVQEKIGDCCSKRHCKKQVQMAMHHYTYLTSCLASQFLLPSLMHFDLVDRSE